MDTWFVQYSQWYTSSFNEWFSLFGQIAVWYLIQKGIVYFLKTKNIIMNKPVTNILSISLLIIIFAPSIKW